MNKRQRVALGALAMAGSLGACGDYLTGTSLQIDPNRPTNAAVDQLFTAVQVSQFLWHEGELARTTGLWVQHLAGITNQALAYSRYDVHETSHAAYFDALFLGGGLPDMRRAVELLGTQDRVYAGIVKVWQAYAFGMGASIWGDFPYSEAGGNKPKLDKQEDVYLAVQMLLDEAIADLQSGAGRNPRTIDMVYGGDAQKWVQAANTLKARFYMHWVEAEMAGNPAAATACDGSCIAQAIEAAQQGISVAAGDFRTFHTPRPGEENVWYQYFEKARVGYIGAGHSLVELLQRRSDPRLTQYFRPVASGAVVGRRPGETGSGAFSTLSAMRLSPSFGQPLITFAETELIQAEANYYLGNEEQARLHLNRSRRPGFAENTASGPELLESVAEEKYVAMFQNMEVWNDYKRTCYPNLPLVGGKPVPARLPYSFNERNANPNIPPPVQQKERNTNDPAGC